MGLGLVLGFGLAFLKDLCEHNKHQRLAWNVGSKLDVSAGKHC